MSCDEVDPKEILNDDASIAMCTEQCGRIYLAGYSFCAKPCELGKEYLRTIGTCIDCNSNRVTWTTSSPEGKTYCAGYSNYHPFVFHNNAVMCIPNDLLTLGKTFGG